MDDSSRRARTSVLRLNSVSWPTLRRSLARVRLWSHPNSQTSQISASSDVATTRTVSWRILTFKGHRLVFQCPRVYTQCSHDEKPSNCMYGVATRGSQVVFGMWGCARLSERTRAEKLVRASIKFADFVPHKAKKSLGKGKVFGGKGSRVELVWFGRKCFFRPVPLSLTHACGRARMWSRFLLFDTTESSSTRAAEPLSKSTSIELMIPPTQDIKCCAHARNRLRLQQKWHRSCAGPCILHDRVEPLRAYVRTKRRSRRSTAGATATACQRSQPVPRGCSHRVPPRQSPAFFENTLS